MVLAETARLVLRRPREPDIEPLMAMDADPEVMRYIGSGAVVPPDRDRALRSLARWRRQWDEQGFGMCSVIVRETGEYAGGSRWRCPRSCQRCLPAVEIGWRLRREHWGYGYATEAAAELLRFGLGDAGLDRVASIRHVDNARSERVMSKLGLRFEFQATVPATGQPCCGARDHPPRARRARTAAAQHKSLAPATTVHACGKRPDDLPAGGARSAAMRGKRIVGVMLHCCPHRGILLPEGSGCGDSRAWLAGRSDRDDSESGSYLVPALADRGVNGDRLPRRQPPWRVFISHTRELAEYPVGGSFVAAVQDAVSALGHVVVEMGGFAARDQAPAALCEEKVAGSDVYVGVLGLRYGSPVRDQPDRSYTELEFGCATTAELPRLMFVLDGASVDHGIPPNALIDAGVRPSASLPGASARGGADAGPFPQCRRFGAAGRAGVARAGAEPGPWRGRVRHRAAACRRPPPGLTVVAGPPSSMSL